MPSWKVTNRASITNQPAWTVGGLGPTVGKGPFASNAIQINANGQGPFRFRTFCTNQLGNIGGGLRNSMFGPSADGTNGCRDQPCVQSPYCIGQSVRSLNSILTIGRTFLVSPSPQPPAPPAPPFTRQFIGFGGQAISSGGVISSFGSLTNPYFNQFQIATANAENVLNTPPFQPPNPFFYNIMFITNIPYSGPIPVPPNPSPPQDVLDLLSTGPLSNFSVEVSNGNQSAVLSSAQAIIQPELSEKLFNTQNGWLLSFLWNIGLANPCPPALCPPSEFFQIVTDIGGSYTLKITEL